MNESTKTKLHKATNETALSVTDVTLR